MSLQLNPQDIPKSLPSPTVESPISTISHVEPVSAAPMIATPDTETTLTPNIRNSPLKPTNPSTTLKSDLALSSSSSSSSSESVKSKPDSVYEKTTIVSHPKAKDQLSIMTEGIIDEVQEYSIPEISTTIQNYEPTNKMDLKVKELITKQGEIVKLNIGGSMFQTTKSTLREDPSSLLAALATANPLPKEIFIDRDPKHFRLILNYLRNGCQISLVNLPKDHSEIKELHAECVFFGLDDLTHALEPITKAGLFL